MPEPDGERAWLERELRDLRAREAEYRQRLGKNETLAARLHAYTQSMHQMFRRRPPTRGELERTLVHVARLSSQALAIRRTSVWCFDAEQKNLLCTLQLVDDQEITPTDLVLEAASCPSYVAALGQDFAVAVHDAPNDMRTVELLPYLKKHDIGALLDIPIVIAGELLGVVCHEHIGGRRTWQAREIDFASGVAQLIALALETERRVQAEHTARGTEAKYQHLVESLPVTVYSFDAHTGKLDYVSPRIAELGGRTAQEWLAAGAGAWIRQIHPDDRAPVLERFRRGVAGGFPQEVTYRVLLPGDKTRWVRDTCSVVRDVAGAPLAFQGVLVDVTAQTEAELSRLEFERRYRSLLENVDLVAVSLDTAGRVTFANDAFVRVSGYTREELVGKDFFSTMLLRDEREAVRKRYLNNLAKGTVPPRLELAIVTRRGEVRRLLCTNTPLLNPDGKPAGASSLALDVTDRRRLEHELLQQTKLESLGRLAAGVAHDFNNLLTVMLAQVELLKRSVATKTDVDLTRQLAALDQVLDQAAELTRSLLTYGRREPSGPMEMCSLDELIRESMPLLEAMAGPELRVTTSLHAEDARLKLDRARMRQVLVNLVGNAADATIGHGRRIQVGTHIEFLDETEALTRGAKEAGEFAVLTVADDGRGMAPSTLARIFDPFFTTKSDGQGTGLGLAITQSIVQQMGGFVSVESEPQVGSTFKIYLPVKPLRWSGVYPQPVGPSATKTSQHVLVVDARPDVREAVAQPLGAQGYEVTSVSSTRSAAEVLATDGVDLMITAEYLPDGSGRVLARSARTIRPNLRAVLIATYGAEAAEDDTFDNVLLEPFNEEQLLKIARSVLERLEEH
jgi:PAS domain S-box-containing protein